jgi:repressor LexA
MPLTPTQKEIFDFLTRFYREHGYAPTIAEIQEHLGFSSSASVHEQLSALENEGVIRRQKRVHRGIELIQSSPQAGECEIPLFGVVAAGEPIEAILNREMIIAPSDLFAPGRFALKVRGDSMMDDSISDGDFIIVEPSQTPRNGQTVVALVDNEAATVKRFFKEQGQIRLQPANMKYKPIIIEDAGRVKIQGIVVGLVRRYE